MGTAPNSRCRQHAFGYPCRCRTSRRPAE